MYKVMDKNNVTVEKVVNLYKELTDGWESITLDHFAQIYYKF